MCMECFGLFCIILIEILVFEKIIDIIIDDGWFIIK